MGLLSLSSPAMAASVVLGYNDSPSGLVAPPTTVAPGVTGSDLFLYTSGEQAPGYAGSWGVTIGTGFSFDVSGFAGTIDTLTFDESNNDCQTGGASFCTDGTTWQVEESLNGGTFSTISTFGAGHSNFTPLPFSIAIGETFNAADTHTFKFSVISVNQLHVGTSQAAAFQNIDLNTSDTPEPGSLGMLGMGMLALGGLVRRKIRK